MNIFFRSGDILTIGGSQFEQNIWAIVFCTLICPVIWNSHIFFLIYCICRNKTLFDRTTSLNGKKILRYKNFCINMVTWTVAQILLLCNKKAKRVILNFFFGIDNSCSFVFQMHLWQTGLQFPWEVF